MITKRRRVCLLSGCATALALGLVAPGWAAAPVTTVYPSATMGTVAQAPRTSALTVAPQLESPSDRPHGTRRIPHDQLPAAQALTAPPTAAGLPITAASPPLVANFNGVGSRDSAVTNFGAEFEPPDQGLCTGNGFVVEMVNSAYTVYRPNGSVVTGPFNVNGPFNDGLVEFTTDPRCHYDAATNTWFAVVAFISADNTVGRIDLAVNTSGDPTKLWTVYRIDATDNGGSTGPKHPGCPCFGDQPLLGIDASNIYITTNEFSILGPDFNGAQVYAISKSDLVALSQAAHFVHFDKLNIGGAPAASIQPALTTKGPAAEFFMNALDPDGTFDQRIGVWAMTNRANIAGGVRPTLSSVVLPSERYGIPPASDQKGSASQLDSGDDRMQQVQFIGGSLWGALGTAVTVPKDTAPRAGIAWFRAQPLFSKGLISGTTTIKQGYVAVQGNSVLYPAIQAGPTGKAVMAFSLTGKTRFPSAAYAAMPAGAAAFPGVTVVAPGTGSYDPDAGRWGDYSWAVLDPSGNTAWLATEYIPPKASQTQDGRRNWGTRVFAVKAK